MIDFEQAMREQDDLDTLLQGHDRANTVEVFSRNNGYGFALILKEFADYDQRLPVHAVIPHGVYVNTERVVREELEAPVPAVLNYPAFRAQTWESSSDKEVIPSASPFLYALDLFRQVHPTPPQQEGTLFFPAHTTDATGHTLSWNALVDSLVALDESRQPVTVCMHKMDYLKGHHTVFADAGMRIVSAGDPWDQEFVFRWLHLLSRHRFAASNDIGGCAYFSVAAGVPFSLIGDVPKVEVDPASRFLSHNMGLFSQRSTPQMVELTAQIRSVFADSADDSPSVEELTGYLLGTENLASREQLHETLERLAKLAEQS